MKTPAWILVIDPIIDLMIDLIIDLWLMDVVLHVHCGLSVCFSSQRKVLYFLLVTVSLMAAVTQQKCFYAKNKKSHRIIKLTTELQLNN